MLHLVAHRLPVPLVSKTLILDLILVSSNPTHGLVSPSASSIFPTRLLIFLGFDLGDQSWPQSMSPPMTSGQLTPGYDPKMMYARSISSSPPRPNLTPEQRELKRQRDVARRDSKVQMRRNRSTSNPYSLSPQPSPEMLSRSLSEYSNGLTPSPLLSQQSSPNMSNISTPAYLSGYTPDPSVDLYGQAFTMYVFITGLFILNADDF